LFKNFFSVKLKTVISRHPVITETWNTACWIRHYKMHWMVVILCL